MGGGQGGAQGGSPGGLDLGGLLQGVMGAGQASAHGGGQGGLDLGSLLQGLMGGGSAGAGSPLASMASTVGQQLGLPPSIAQMVIGFVMSKLLGGQQGRSGMVDVLGQAGSPSTGFNVNELADLLSSGGTVDHNYVQSTGLVEELSQQTGLDPATASRSLTHVLNLLGGAQPAATVSATKAAKPTRKR
jgi:hypothetical protein